MNVERRSRGQLAGTWRWAERAGMGRGLEKGRERGQEWGQASSAAAPPSHPACGDGSSRAPALSLPASCPPQHLPGRCQHLDFRTPSSEGVGKGPCRGQQGPHRAHPATPHHPRPGGHTDTPARCMACPLAAACRAKHRRLSPVCRRDRADPLLKHQRCSKFFNLPNRSISNYHVSHS